MIENVAENTRLGENMFPRHSSAVDRITNERPHGKSFIEIDSLDDIVNAFADPCSQWVGDYFKMRERRNKCEA